MTIFTNTTTTVRRQLNPAARHAYAVPIVRELPAPAPEPTPDLTW